MRFFAAFIITLSILASFQNCSPQSKKEKTNLASNCKATPLQESTVHGKSSSLRGVVFKAGVDVSLNLRVDVQCAYQSEQWSAQFIDDSMLILPFKTLTYKTADLSGTLQEIDNDPCVTGAYPNSGQLLKPQQTQEVVYPLTNDPFANQAYFKTMGFDRGQLRFFHPMYGISNNVRVAVIDTGVDYNHPDLANSMWTNANGFHGLRIYDNSQTPLDDDQHGTHVSGIIGATSNNGIGVRSIGGGVAEIMAINSIVSANNPSFSIENLVTAIDYAIVNGAQVINMSLGGPGTQPTELRDAIIRALNAGIIIVAAAGNENSDASAYFPASNTIEFAGVISVASIDIDGEKSSFSNFSSVAVDIAASGNESSGRVDRSILSTVPQGEYNRLAGTSMATPVVTAAVALTIGFLETHGIAYNVAMVEDIVFSSARQDTNLVQVTRDGKVLDLDKLSATLYSLAGITADPVAEYDTDYITNVLNNPDLNIDNTDPAEVCQ